MKILIYGAGVVGCSYGWQLSKAGCDVAVLVRKEQKELVQKDGIRIICSDFREKARKDTDIIFKPTVIDELSSNNDFEYIIVSTNKLQLSTILPSLSKSAGKANVVFFQNNWDVFTEIDKYLKPEQYFFAFPFMVGGGKEDKSIHCAISGLKYSNTPLGEKDGRTTPRVEKLSIILDKAKTAYGGAELKYGYKDWFDASLKGTFYSWKTDNENEELYLMTKPKFELNFYAEAKVFEGLKVYLGYEYVQRKEYVIEEGNSSRDFGLGNISNLSVGASYTFLKDLSVFGRVNNLLNKQYYYEYGYPAEKLNVLAGLSLVF